MNQPLVDFINSHEHKMEIGASNNPLCNGINTTFVDNRQEGLLNTFNKLKIIGPSSCTYSSVQPIFQFDSSMDCIVSSFFSVELQCS